MFYLLNYSRIWWALLDSTQVSREATDLQSARFDRLPKYPNTAVVVVTTIETLQTTPRVLYTLMVYGNKLPNIIFAKGRYRFALLVRKVGLEPTRVIHSQDFKSCASTNSATCAFIMEYIANLQPPSIGQGQVFKVFVRTWCTKKESNLQTLVSKTSCFASLHIRAFNIEAVRIRGVSPLHLDI